MNVCPIVDDTRGRWRVEVDGHSLRFDPESASSLKEVAKALGTTRREILEAVRRHGEDDGPTGFVVTVDGEEVAGPTPLEALDAAIERGGEFIRWTDGERLRAVDIDVRHPWDEERLDHVALRAGADRHWLTKSGGGRLIVAADLMTTATERAAAVVALLGLSEGVEKVELLNHTRTPPADSLVRSSTYHRGNSLLWAVAHADQRAQDPEAEADAADWLEEEGMEIGQRYPHDRCVLDPRPVSGTDPVVILDGGVYCFRCANTTGDGYRSWGALLHDRVYTPHPLALAAREHVHWAHQKVVMRAQWPSNVAWSAAKPAYRGLLKAYGASEDELGAVFGRDWKWLRGEGGLWLDPTDLTAADIRSSASSCSYARGNQTRVTHLLNPHPIAGYTMARPAPFVARPECLPPDVVPIFSRADINPHRPDVMPWADALAYVRQSLPAIDETYVQASLAACVCAEGGGVLVGLLAVGPSGTGKTGVAMFVSGLMGSTCPTLRLAAPTEDWRRQFGQALVSGARVVVANEVDKLGKFRSSHMPKLLDLQDPHQWRPLYGGDIRTPIRAPLVLTGILPPDAFRTPELGRRFRMLRLSEVVPDEAWQATSSAAGGLNRWREQSDERALVADSMVRWGVDYAAARDYSWHRCADDLGLPLANADDLEQRNHDDAQLRALYEHCCGRRGERIMSPSSRYPADHGWVDLTSPAAQALLEPMLDDCGASVDPRYMLGRDLAARDWPTLLGDAAGSIIFETRTRYQVWVGRFRSPTRGPDRQ